MLYNTKSLDLSVIRCYSGVVTPPPPHEGVELGIFSSTPYIPALSETLLGHYQYRVLLRFRLYNDVFKKSTKVLSYLSTCSQEITAIKCTRKWYQKRSGKLKESLFEEVTKVGRH